MNLISILGDVSIWIILLPLFIGLSIYQRLNNESKLIFCIVVLGAIPQVLRPFLNGSLILTVLYNLYTPAEFFVYFFVFVNKIHSKKNILFSKSRQARARRRPGRVLGRARRPAPRPPRESRATRSARRA